MKLVCSVDAPLILVHLLERLGELEIRRGQGRGHVNFYRVHVTPEEKVQSLSEKRCNLASGKRAIYCTQK